MAGSLTILGSGSSGNCAYLETGEVRLLIDAGLSGRQIRLRLAAIGRTPELLTGILITHEHSDHTQGLAVIAAKLGIPVYCNRLTKDAIRFQTDAPMDYRIFETGGSFGVGEAQVETFSVPHDASDPVGFMIHTPETKLGVVTDLGHATKLVLERVRQARVLLLEANYDVKLLQEDTRRPWSIKQRICSRHGHLSNEAAAEVLAQVVTADLKQVYLAHLSRDCNRPELALQVATDRLRQLGASHVTVANTWQDKPTATHTLPAPC